MLKMPADLAEFDRLIDEATAEAVFTKMQWPNGPCCFRCGSHNVRKIAGRAEYQCREGECRAQTSVRCGSVLHRSRVSFRDWLYVTWRCITPAATSARSIARELNWRYDKAWVLAHKVRASLAERGAWRIFDTAELAVCQVPAPKHANGDPPDRPPVAVAIAVAEEPTESTKDRVRFAVGPVTQPDAELLMNARFDLVEPGTEANVHPRRVEGPTNQVGWMINDVFARLKRWLAARFRGVSRKYLPNYLAQFAYVENRWHDLDNVFASAIRRLATERWRSRADLALAAP
jgi:hypothetical protein